MDEWRRLTAEGDLEGLLSLLADDVIFLTPGNPPITKNDFAIGFRDVAGKARIETMQDVKEIRVSGDIASAWSHLTVVLTPKQARHRRNRGTSCPFFSDRLLENGCWLAMPTSSPVPAIPTGLTSPRPRRRSG